MGGGEAALAVTHAELAIVAVGRELLTMDGGAAGTGGVGEGRYMRTRCAELPVGFCTGPGLRVLRREVTMGLVPATL